MLPNDKTRPIPRILMTGGAGFIGRTLANLLVAKGYRVTIPTRNRTRNRPLILMPGLDLLEADLNDDATLERLVRGHSAVINLVGVLHSRPGTPYGPEFRAAHVQFPARLARVVARHQVRHLVHVSALGASPEDADRLPSMYLRSKSDGERALLDTDVPLTIFRPSIVFGPEDKFLNTFARIQRWVPVMVTGGTDARIQPVYVLDVAQAMRNVLFDSHHFGKTYELAGPETFTLRQLIELAGRLIDRARPVIGLPDALARVQAFLLEHAPGGPVMSRDNLDSMRVPNVSAQAFPPELGVTPHALTAVAPQWLAPRELRMGAFRRRAHR